MSEYQSVIELAQKAERDGSLRAALQRCQSPDEVVRVAGQAGVTVSADELRALGDRLRSMQERAGTDELSEAELETVAGGAILTGITTAVLTAGIMGALGVAVAGSLTTMGIGMANMANK